MGALRELYGNFLRHHFCCCLCGLFLVWLSYQLAICKDLLFLLPIEVIINSTNKPLEIFIIVLHLLLLNCIYYCITLEGREVTQSCPTLCDPMVCSSPGSSIHGIFQARILEWVVISFSIHYDDLRYKTQECWMAKAKVDDISGSWTITKSREFNPPGNISRHATVLCGLFLWKFLSVTLTST